MSSGLPRALLVGCPAKEEAAMLEALSEAGYRPQALDRPLAAINPREEPWALLVLDLRGDFEPIQEIERFHQQSPETAVLALVPEEDLALAVSAMKSGARLCLALPLKGGRLASTAGSLLRTVDLEGQVSRLRQALLSRQAGESIVGSSPALMRCLELARLVAGYPLNVLLTGESGVGKESMAAFIHQSSSRAQGAFVAVDCGALSEDLADDELFGHKKGAFTGAEGDRLGRFLEADGGTLFLDEIGNLPLAMQAKLLRVLQSKEVWPLGADQAQAVDLRIIAATNEDLPDLVKEGRFRLDLYHRLEEFSLRVPSLRERREDIEALCLYFLTELSRRFGREVPALDEAALGRLQSYPWPGNIRQLQNAMKHACVVAGPALGVADLPEEVAASRATAVEAPAEPSSDGQFFSVPEGMLELWQAEERVTKEVERRMISEAMLLQRGDKAGAAEALGIHAKTLARKLREHGLMALVGR